MSNGTLYIMLRSSRSYWLPLVIKNLGLDIKVVEYETDPTFAEKFPLKKTPAFIGADGFKLTETVAIAEYFVTLASDTKLGGKDDKEKAQITRWLSFFNQDVNIAGGNVRFRSKTEEEIKTSTEYLVFLYKYIDAHLATQKYFVNDSYVTIADVYAYVTLDRNLSLTKGTEFPNIARFLKDIIAADPVAAELSKK